MPRDLTKERQAYDALDEAVKAHNRRVDAHFKKVKRSGHLMSALLLALIFNIAFAVLICFSRNHKEISTWIQSLL